MAQNIDSINLEPGTSRSQVEHTTNEPLQEANMIRVFRPYHKGD